MAGIPVGRRITSTYVASSVLAGIVGILVIGRMNVADPSVGVGWELVAIAAAVVGGVSLFGGEGRILGIAAGAILLEFIANGLLALHVSPYYQQGRPGRRAGRGDSVGPAARKLLRARPALSWLYRRVSWMRTATCGCRIAG